MKQLNTISFSLVIGLVALGSCGKKTPTTKAELSTITESIYSSGIISSENQYNIYPKVSGQVIEVLVEAGDTVVKGQPLLTIENELQNINSQNASLSSSFYSKSNNQQQFKTLKNNISLAEAKMQYDSTQYSRQVKLQDAGAGTKVELEASKIAYESSVANYNAALLQLDEFNRQLNFNYNQALNNLKMSTVSKDDYILKSAIDGIVYDINCTAGDLISPQRPVGVLGGASSYILSMLIDEGDILNIAIGQEVIVKLDSYSDTTFTARITKIYPLMDTQSKSFEIEAVFEHPPATLYPNMNFEANILVNTKGNALLIPREYLYEEAYVILENNDTVKVTTGLKDYRKIEILSGLQEGTTIKLPE